MSDKDDWRFERYRELSELERVKSLGPNQEWVPLDVTGDARYSEERDRISAMLRHLNAYDGGMLWDFETATLTIQMTSEEALQEARLLLLVTNPTWLRVMFVQVQYSSQELRELADRLFHTTNEWGPPSGFLAGSWGNAQNRVVFVLSEEPEDQPEAWVAAIEAFHDPRIVYEFVPRPAEPFI